METKKKLRRDIQLLQKEIKSLREIIKRQEDRMRRCLAPPPPPKSYIDGDINLYLWADDLDGRLRKLETKIPCIKSKK